MSLTPLKLIDVRFASETGLDGAELQTQPQRPSWVPPANFTHSGAWIPRAA